MAQREDQERREREERERRERERREGGGRQGQMGHPDDPRRRGDDDMGEGEERKQP